MTVAILEDAAEDIQAGRYFYESRERGIRDYFVETILDMRRDPVWLRSELGRRR